MIRRAAFAAMTVLAGCLPASAQWAPWDDDPFWERPSPRYQRYPRYRDRYWDDNPYWYDERPRGPSVIEGGARPEIKPEAPETVAFPYGYEAGSIVIDTAGRKLYYVTAPNQAYSYPISVGRQGFTWTGTETISRKQAWPDWHPPEEMRDRDPKLPEKMTGGIRNPLGAMALYLGNSLYRIHGTNDAKTIGQAASSGCFRMMNTHVVHLASLADVGTKVTVVKRLPSPETPGVAQRSAPPPPADRNALGGADRRETMRREDRNRFERDAPDDYGDDADDQGSFDPGDPDPLPDDGPDGPRDL